MIKGVLLLDAGNTRLKWAVVDGARIEANTAGLSESAAWLGQGVSTYDALGELSKQWWQFGELTACVGVHVADQSARSRVEQLVNEWALTVQWLHASNHAGGVHNAYQPPHSLGADRWAALRAARQRSLDSVLVISAGTALTIDALAADGHFLGGLILPGLHGMRYALAHGTAQIGMQHGTFQDFPTTTADAVESGAIHACVGAIAAMRQKLERRSGGTPRLILSGGDSEYLRRFLPAEAIAVPSLVLEGVYFLSQEEHPQ